MPTILLVEERNIHNRVYNLPFFHRAPIATNFIHSYSILTYSIHSEVILLNKS